VVAAPLSPVTTGASNRTTTFSLLPLAVTGAMAGHEIVSGSSGPVVDGGGVESGFFGGAGAGDGCGAAAEATITAERHDAVSLFASTALQLMSVVPTGNSEPEAGVQLDETGALPPDTLGEKVTATGAPSGEVAEGTGHRIVGAVGGLYVTTTDVVHDARNCSASTAVQVAGVDPTGKSDPDAGEHEAVTGATPPDTAGENVIETGLPSVDDAIGDGH
jgi:hypothetical protein